MGIIEKMRLDGKRGFVTGAARGIGKCTATAFAEAGADVAIVDMDLETAQATAQEIAQATGRKVIALKCDVTDEAQVQAMVDEVVRQLGGLDFCHANAGICINAPADEMTYAQWNAMAPMGRLGKPEELESICVYLAGDTSTFTTGADFGLDGAFTCF